MISLEGLGTLGGHKGLFKIDFNPCFRSEAVSTEHVGHVLLAYNHIAVAAGKRQTASVFQC